MNVLKLRKLALERFCSHIPTNSSKDHPRQGENQNRGIPAVPSEPPEFIRSSLIVKTTTTATTRATTATHHRWARADLARDSPCEQPNSVTPSKFLWAGLLVLPGTAAILRAAPQLPDISVIVTPACLSSPSVSFPQGVRSSFP